jgi:hypothetical protein
VSVWDPTRSFVLNSDSFLIMPFLQHKSDLETREMIINNRFSFRHERTRGGMDTHTHTHTWKLKKKQDTIYARLDIFMKIFFFSASTEKVK